MRTPRIVALASGAALVGALVLAAPAAGKDDDGHHRHRHGGKLVAHLHALNNSGVTGFATAKVRDTTIRKVTTAAWGLTPDGAHLQHIHFGATARHECPTFVDDSNGDHRLTVAEGGPAYGPIAVSLTTTGDTSPASGGAFERMPVAKDGMLAYARMGIEIGDAAVAEAIRKGQGVVVIHGIDYNRNGAYDAAETGEPSDPAACGVLARAGHHGHDDHHGHHD